MQLRGRNGWLHWERPKLALRTTGQREKKVFGCHNILNIYCKSLSKTSTHSLFTIAELQENTETLKTKMSELRLYCDLLLQQVNKIKENDELDTAEVRLRFGWADEIREAAVVVWICSPFATSSSCMRTSSKSYHEYMFLKSLDLSRVMLGYVAAFAYVYVPFSDGHRHWKHGEVYMHHFP